MYEIFDFIISCWQDLNDKIKIFRCFVLKLGADSFSIGVGYVLEQELNPKLRLKTLNFSNSVLNLKYVNIILKKIKFFEREQKVVYSKCAISLAFQSQNKQLNFFVVFRN